MYKKTMFGEITNPKVNTMHDLTVTEMFTIGFLGFLCVFLGVYPKVITNIIPIFNLTALL